MFKLERVNDFNIGETVLFYSAIEKDEYMKGILHEFEIIDNEIFVNLYTNNGTWFRRRIENIRKVEEE